MSEKEVQSWFKELPGKIQRELAKDLQRIANELSNDIRAAAPVVTGTLRDSVRVRRGRKTLEYFVEAGGSTTTRQYGGSARYQREVVIGSGDTQGIARGGSSGKGYDYALGVEFGNTHMPAQPFFYTTYRVRQAQVREEVEQAVLNAVSRA